MTDSERTALLRLLRPLPIYDFRIADPGFIENSSGEFFYLPKRCWTVLSHATWEPLGFDEASDLLNRTKELHTGQKEILLEKDAIEYIVSKTNSVLRLAKSIHRLSAARGSFSVR